MATTALGEDLDVQETPSRTNPAWAEAVETELPALPFPRRTDPELLQLPDSGDSQLEDSLNLQLYSHAPQCFCFPSEANFAARPRLKNLVITFMLAPPALLSSFVVQQIDAQISQRGLILFLVWSTIKDVVSWMNTIFSFFWYVQQCTISKLVGQHNSAGKERIGASIGFSSICAILSGVLTMIICVSIADPLLELFAPVTVNVTGSNMSHLASPSDARATAKTQSHWNVDANTAQWIGQKQKRPQMPQMMPRGTAAHSPSLSPTPSPSPSLSPSPSNVMRHLGAEALRILAVQLPASVYLNAGIGTLMGFHEVLKTVGIVTVGMVLSELGIVSAILKMDCVTPSLNPCHSFNEDSSDAYSYTSQGPSEVYDTTKNLTDLSTCQLSFDKHGWVCPDYEVFLRNSSIWVVIGQYFTAVTIFLAVYYVARKREYHFNWRRLGSTEVLDIRNLWATDTAYVAVRSVVNNTRRVVSLLVAVRIGLVQGAVWSMFTSVSALSYDVPILLASVAMMQVSRQLGEKKYGMAVQILNDYRMFGVVCALLFALRFVIFKETTITEYSSESERESFEKVADSIWLWVVVYQPIYALLSTYSALISSFQEFVFWGQTVFVVMVVVFTPMVIGAVYYESLALLIAAEVAYALTLVIAFYIKLHFYVLPVLLHDQGGSMQGIEISPPARAGVVEVDSEGGVAEVGVEMGVGSGGEWQEPSAVRP